MPDFGGDGFEEFVDAELPRLVGLGHALTGNPHDAWELRRSAWSGWGCAGGWVNGNFQPEVDHRLVWVVAFLGVKAHRSSVPWATRVNAPISTGRPQ